MATDMRTMPAAVAKQGWHYRAQRNLRPREGTKLRAMYDLLMANKGVPIDISLSKLYGRKCMSSQVSALTDFYGLDIRNLKRGRWVLAGEWFGATYVDYIADRIAKAEKSK